MNEVSWFQSLISKYKGQIVLIGVVILIVVGAIATAEHYSSLADSLNAKASVLMGRIEETESQRLRALNLRDEATGWAKQANARVEFLQKELEKRPYPPKPKPVPATAPELGAVLVTFGLVEPVTVLEMVLPSTIGRSDAMKIYEWASQSQRVAPLEDRVSGQGALIVGLQDEVVAVKKTAYFTNEALSKTTDQLVLTQEQLKVFSASAKASAKKAMIQKWLYAGGAVVLGYAVGKK